jgi:hypothetical protein
MAGWNTYLNGILGQWQQPGPVYDPTGNQVLLPPQMPAAPPSVLNGNTPQIPDSGDDFWGTKNPDGTSSYLGGLVTYDPTKDISKGDRLGYFGAALADAGAQFSGHPADATNLNNYIALSRKQRAQDLMQKLFTGMGQQQGPGGAPLPMSSGAPSITGQPQQPMGAFGMGPTGSRYSLRTMAPVLAQIAAAGGDVGPIVSILKDAQPKYSTDIKWTKEGKPYITADDGSVQFLDPSITPRDKYEVTNGVAYDPYALAPGQVLPQDPNKAFSIGPDGQPVANTAYQQYEKSLKAQEQAPQWARLDFDKSKFAAGVPDEATLHDMAVRYVHGDRMAAGSLGRNPQAQTAFQKMISQVGTEEGLKPQEISQNIQKFQAGTKAISAFDTGKQGDVTRSLNVFVQHSDLLDQMADAMNNGDTKGYNVLANIRKDQTGQAAPNSMKAVAQIWANELQKATLGEPGGEMERQALAAAASPNLAPQVIHDLVGKAKHLAAGQLSGLRQQFVTSTQLPASEYDAKLFPATAEALNGYTPPSGTAPVGKKTSPYDLPRTKQAPQGVSGGVKWRIVQ